MAGRLGKGHLKDFLDHKQCWKVLCKCSLKSWNLEGGHRSAWDDSVCLHGPRCWWSEQRSSRWRRSCVVGWSTVATTQVVAKLQVRLQQGKWGSSRSVETSTSWSTSCEEVVYSHLQGSRSPWTFHIQKNLHWYFKRLQTTGWEQNIILRKNSEANSCLCRRAWTSGRTTCERWRS